jgi:two-component system, NarL family, nitrate/nitrite response regulator NarL
MVGPAASGVTAAFPARGRAGVCGAPSVEVTRVFIVSGISLYREGLSVLLSRRDGIDVVGAAANGPDASRMLHCARRPPDIVLLDMSATDGLTTARRLIHELGDVRVFAITVPNRESAVVACAEAGVVGFVTSEASLDELIAALESLAQGELLCPPAMAAALFRRVATLAHERERSNPLARLTSREQEILALVDDGLSNKEIAERLYVELPTVRNHVHSILGKLGVHRRAQAAALLRSSPEPQTADPSLENQSGHRPQADPD